MKFQQGKMGEYIAVEYLGSHAGDYDNATKETIIKAAYRIPAVRWSGRAGRTQETSRHCNRNQYGGDPLQGHPRRCHVLTGWSFAPIVRTIDTVIVSHKHKLIFIKTQKTAGTSIEVALSSLCGPDDIITPVQSWIEDDRAGLAGRGAQNYRLNHPLVPKTAGLETPARPARAALSSHYRLLRPHARLARQSLSWRRNLVELLQGGRLSEILGTAKSRGIATRPSQRRMKKSQRSTSF